MSDVNASAAATAPASVGTVGESDRTPVAGQGQQSPAERPRSLGRDAWEDLRRNKIFLISAVLILALVVMSVAPGLFTDKSPTDCNTRFSRQPPGGGAVFGFDTQGCDVYARTIYGARASVLVGVLASLSTLVLGSVAGVIAGFYGGWVDSVLSRITDMFFAIPLLLGGILVLTSFPSDENTGALASILKVTFALALLGWTSTARIMRSSAIQAKSTDYVQAARALGASNLRIITRHVLPNSFAPVIVVATIALGGYIGAEATLSFLGIGLQPPVVSWGIAISDAQRYVRVAPHMLIFPGVFLSVTVLAFIMLGDAVRDALDPKLR